VRSLFARHIGVAAPICAGWHVLRGCATSSQHDLDAEVSVINDDRECPLPIIDPHTSCVEDISDDVVGMTLVRLSLVRLSLVRLSLGEPVRIAVRASCVAKDTNGD
jgi:hypothetical protein